MKKILFFRHSDSPFYPNISDYDRPLSSLGIKKAKKISLDVKEKSFIPNLFISSTAKRAMETCDTIRENLNANAPRLTYEEIYTGGRGAILNILRSLDDEVDTISIFGHNPTMHDIHNAISRKKIPYYETAGVMDTSLDVKLWIDFSFSSLILKSYYYPILN